jgi:predicted enzyme related to lactoylglutathione lyase
MEMTSYEHGLPSWIDVSTSDLARDIEFYSQLFGWECQQGPPETGGYTIAEIGGKAVAGIGPQMNPAAAPSWMVYVNVDSADDIAKKVADNGGQTFMAPMDVMDVGRMAVFADPVGAVFGIWQPGAHKGAALVNEPNTFAWCELVTTDVDRSKAFYTSVFGWGTGGAPEYVEWQLGGRTMAGMMPKPKEMPAEIPPYWNVYFAVADIDDAVDAIQKLGGQIVAPRMDSPAGPFAVAVDPTGASFSVIQLT